MKKQNTTTQQNNEKAKRQKKQNLFFVYADNKGFLIHSDDSMPTFSMTGEIMLFSEKRKAVAVVDFIKQFKIADNVSVFAKVIA
jgi:hypothetical protein